MITVRELTESLECGDLSPLFRLNNTNEKRRQVAALQRLPPFQVKWLIALSFNLHGLQLIELSDVNVEDQLLKLVSKNALRFY
jgi:hypothetical protein